MEEPGQNQSKTLAGTRREALAFEAVDPADGKLRLVQLSYDKIKSLPLLGKGKIMDAGFVVPEILAKPTAIFKGLALDKDEPRRGAGWLCYSGRPTRCFEDDGKEFACPPKRVFLVFVNSEWVAYNWYWHPEDHIETGLPTGYKERFEEKVL